MYHQKQNDSFRKKFTLRSTTLKIQTAFVLYMIKMKDPRKLLSPLEFLIRNLKGALKLRSLLHWKPKDQGKEF